MELVHKIRLAKVSEITSLVELDKKASMTPWSYENYISSFDNKNHKIYLLENANQIIGTIVIAQAVDEAEIIQLWIKKEFQHNGYGKILLQYAIGELKKNNAAQIFLEVRSDNIPAISLYKNFGFLEVGKRNDYYKVDMWRFDAIVMLKNL